MEEENPSNHSKDSDISSRSHSSQRRIQQKLPRRANDPFFMMGEFTTLEQGQQAFLQAAEAVIELLEEEDPDRIRVEEVEDHCQTLFRRFRPVVYDRIKFLSVASGLPLWYTYQME